MSRLALVRSTVYSCVLLTLSPLACSDDGPEPLGAVTTLEDPVVADDPPIDPVVLDDFADGDARGAASVGTWKAATGAANADGQAALAWPDGGFDGRDRFLRLTYRVGSGAYHYSHAILALAQAGHIASGSLTFWVRGQGTGQVDLLLATPLQGTANNWAAWRARVPVTATWQQVTLPFDATTFQWNGADQGRYTLEQALASVSGFVWESQVAGESGVVDLDHIEVRGLGTETGGRYELIWSDEFNGPELRSTRWNHEVNGDGGYTNNELQYYTDEPKNAFVEDGALRITAYRERYRDRDYTSARLNTRFNADWTYGRFEVRAKLPIGKGYWPAIWMLPSDWEYGDWPRSGEIDIMEVIGQEPGTLHGTAHYGDLPPNNKRSEGFYWLQGTDFSQDFHVFAVEWQRGELRWFVDGVHYHTAWLDKPFDKRFHLLLNVAVGGVWPGDPDPSTVFPQAMQVDYARVYRAR